MIYTYTYIHTPTQGHNKHARIQTQIPTKQQPQKPLRKNKISTEKLNLKLFVKIEAQKPKPRPNFI